MPPLNYSMTPGYKATLLLSLLITTMLATSNPPKLYASPSGVGFYSLTSPPPGVKSLEPLIAKFWNWVISVPSASANNWPVCLKGDLGKIGNNQSVVALGDGPFAVAKNINARNQNCEISSNQLPYLVLYSGECSTLPTPGQGEFPNTKSPPDLLKCAHDSNAGIVLMQAKVDGNDVSSSIIRESTSQPFNFTVPLDNIAAFPTPIAGGNNYSMAENYYLFFRPLPVGVHTIDYHVIRVPSVGGQQGATEDDVAHYTITVVR